MDSAVTAWRLCDSSGPLIAPSNGVATKLACAAKYGQAHSMGAAFGGGAIANYLGGNTVSSLVNLGLAATGNQPLSSQPYLTGVGLGLPVNDVLRFSGGTTNPLYSSPGGYVRSQALQGIFNAATESSGVAAEAGLSAGEFASGIGLAKFGLDTLTFAVGYFGTCSQ